MATFKASALRNIATQEVKKVGTLGRKPRFGDVMGSRMLEVNFVRPNGWETPVIRDFGNLQLMPMIAGLHYGLQCFDHFAVMRDVNTGKPRMFHVHEVLRRLAMSRDRIALNPYEDAELLECLKALVRADVDSIPEGYGESLVVRACLIGNNRNLSAGPADESKLFAFSSAEGVDFDKVNHLKVSQGARKSWVGGTGSVNLGGNYSNQIYHEAKVKKDGFSHYLWTTDGQVDTAGSKNVFLVFKNKNSAKGFKLVTPELAGVTLNGMMRVTAIEIAQKFMTDVEVETRPVQLKEIIKGIQSGELVEMFGTGTYSGTTAIGSITHFDKKYTLPVAGGEDSFTRRMHKCMIDLKCGKVASQWSVLVD